MQRNQPQLPTPVARATVSMHKELASMPLGCLLRGNVRCVPGGVCFQPPRQCMDEKRSLLLLVHQSQWRDIPITNCASHGVCLGKLMQPMHYWLPTVVYPSPFERLYELGQVRSLHQAGDIRQLQDSSCCQLTHRKGPKHSPIVTSLS